MSVIFSFEGQGGTLVDRGDNTYGGKWVINPSGGLISKGHPLGATGNTICTFHKLNLNVNLYSLNLTAGPFMLALPWSF
jgi:acetyl-CoA acetyltransferase